MVWTSSVPSSPTTVTTRPLPSSSPMRTTPEVRARVALPFGAAGLEQLDHAGQTAGDVAAAGATPPVWKVRMVSWVPGSPIDWAAMTPTASPSSIVLAGGQRQAVARPQMPSSESSVSGDEHPDPGDRLVVAEGGEQVLVDRGAGRR